ncbi:MAG: hypothetical protein A2784_04865 [Candidatus Chisholmbacteria bacterium RIFCSPHIGHO2_01_FULL_48_12]|uniref:Uncharacterized protein n=1 Tax=Candidatus Chisholmbacteria bacterium RIFCSPHIGHO2_01_FULL_48_12 TaxID=1797589 RepID=A0A1G1VRZ5_9BACT|nr:MAG: hypothetical protein A2784_04865 [Candidatus Chisholmbacteria bacterium RIFCSPHIGHO2_01_FULL_48_12]
MSDAPADQGNLPVAPVSGPKEQKDAFAPSEVVRPAEAAETHEEEVEGWLERLERGEDIHLPQPVTDDQTGQVLVAPASPPAGGEIVLPVSEEGVKKGLHLQVWDSLRWLAEWSLRILKMFPGRAVYPDGK